MSSARLAGSKGKEGKGGVRGIHKVVSGSGDGKEIKQGEGSMDDEGPDEGESGGIYILFRLRGRDQGNRAVGCLDTHDATVLFYDQEEVLDPIPMDGAGPEGWTGWGIKGTDFWHCRGTALV
ncbi:hypothetical protein FB451DRAFT_1170468 [Mycena latifolia]|nr:hypothetical protein FB451DRAFT_1170468 [Mycena latifolia]